MGKRMQRMTWYLLLGCCPLVSVCWLSRGDPDSPTDSGCHHLVSHWHCSISELEASCDLPEVSMSYSLVLGQTSHRTCCSHGRGRVPGQSWHSVFYGTSTAFSKEVCLNAVNDRGGNVTDASFALTPVNLIVPVVIVFPDAFSYLELNVIDMSSTSP